MTQNNQNNQENFNMNDVIDTFQDMQFNDCPQTVPSHNGAVNSAPPHTDYSVDGESVMEPMPHDCFDLGTIDLNFRLQHQISRQIEQEKKEAQAEQKRKQIQAKQRLNAIFNHFQVNIHNNGGQYASAN